MSRYVKPWLVSLALVASLRVDGGQDPSGPDRIHQAIESAKARSLKEISLVPTSGLRTGIDDLDSAAQACSLLVVEPQKKVVSTSFRDHIMTWYKLGVKEVISRQKTRGDDLAPEPPAELLPVESDQILLLVPGGMAKIDGITVRETYVVSSQLVLNKSYLMCIDVKGGGGHVGTLAAGSEGVFVIQADGSLKALAPIDRGLPKDIHARFADNIDFVRSYAKDVTR